MHKKSLEQLKTSRRQLSWSFLFVSNGQRRAAVSAQGGAMGRNLGGWGETERSRAGILISDPAHID